MIFQITHKDKSTKARVGILKTRSGKIETPFFMPVATKATAKYINPKQLEELTPVIISNALILSIRPGTRIIRKLGGIKKFMNFKGINFTDSGGFQMYSDSIFIKSINKGVYFKNPVSGEKLFITPEENMKIQLDIGADVALCLDKMPLYKNSKKEIQRAVEITSNWAERCKKEHDRLQKNIDINKKQLLFGITQGGVYSDLRKKSAESLVAMNFDGYAIGGFGLGELFREEMRIVKQQKSIIPENKPVYLMGIGNPKELLEAISLGCDIFDSRMPTQNARRGTLFTSKGKFKILNKKYSDDGKSIDPNCKCFVCKTYSRAYIRYLLKENEPVGKELASYHNLYYVKDLIEQAKTAIKQNQLKKLITKIKKIYS